MNWQSFKEEILISYPFLDKFRFGFKESQNHFSPPPILTLGSFVAVNLISNEISTLARSAIIFPHSDSIACHIAVAASLAAIKKQFDRGLPELPELKPDEKVLLDGVDYIYKGEEIISGEPFMVFNYQNGAPRKIPVSERLRVQHSVSSRQIAKRDKNLIKSVVDPVLGTKLRGNTSLFQTSVILVSKIFEAREQVSGLSIAANDNACTKLSNVFGWGSLTEEGEVKIWGNAGRKEEPLVLVSSNFADVCEYVEVNSHKTDLIVVDGTSYLKDLSSFENLLHKNIPVVFVLSGKDHDGVQYLKKKDFDFWAWNSEDLKNLHKDFKVVEESPFFDLTKKLDSFASFDAEVIDCSNTAFEEAFELLNDIRREITEEDYHASQILDHTYDFFRRASRLVAAAKQIIEKSERQIASIETDLKTFRYYIKPEFYESFVQIVDLLKQGNIDLNGANSKPAKLRSQIGSLLSSGHQKICVILSKSDFQVEKDFLSAQFPGRKIVFERNASFKMQNDYDCIILCGYLKRNHLLRIFDEALGARLIILNYPHEKEWTKSVKKQFFGAFDNQAFRNEKIFGDKLQLNIHVKTAVAPPQIPILEEFEIKLHEFKKQRILRNINEDSYGQKVAAKCVTFNQGSFAFLTESYSVPVINELLGGKKVEKIPQKRIKDISPGDFLLFRESSNRNLIREMADLGLKKSGKSDLRKISSAWREALRKIYEINNQSLSKVKAELKKYGCDRNEFTIKNWLFDENQIAPGEDEDILAIAAAGDHNLSKKYDDMIAAISQVRGAHIQAARQVARLLEKRIKGDLGDFSESDVEIIVPGLGKVFIVCVESIDSETTEIPGHKANRILKEKEQDNGTNDSTAIVG